MSHIGPDSLYPDPKLTPGKAETLKVDDLTDKWACKDGTHTVTCTYSQAHRDVRAHEHKDVYDEYKVPAPQRNTKYGEVDHFYPLCAGGSNDLQNLWYQPARSILNGTNFGYHQKDKLESFVCRQIKARKIDPAVAYKRITEDWVKYYQEIFLKP